MDYNQNLFGEKIEEESLEQDVVGPKGKPDFNIFILTDALGARKKKDAWVLYRKALASGMAPEDVFFKLFWQVKTMLLAKRTKTAEEADMKSYPYGKAKGYLNNFKEGEIEKLSEKLVLGYHAVRRGEGEMETFVEKAVLSI